MYLPKRFENENTEQAVDLIRRYPFSTLISSTEAGPFVSHLPLVIESDGQKLVLFGHLARANPHWRLLDRRDVYVVINGPHSYITPTWYAENDVPTWNYAVVHMKGVASLIEDRTGISDCLKKLASHLEKNRPNPWEFWIPPDLAGNGSLESAIVGFKISIESVKSKFKLSQNRSREDRAGVMHGLETQSDDMSLEVLRLMRGVDL